MGAIGDLWGLHPVPGSRVTVAVMTDLFLGDAPAACTLPTVERPLRVVEFGRLFAGGLRAQTRVSATRLRWVLDPAAEAEARDLTARESQCCSFFVFDVTSGQDADGEVVVVVDVPAELVAVLDALESLAAQAKATGATR